MDFQTKQLDVYGVLANFKVLAQCVPTVPVSLCWWTNTFYILPIFIFWFGNRNNIENYNSIYFHIPVVVDDALHFLWCNSKLTFRANSFLQIEHVYSLLPCAVSLCFFSPSAVIKDVLHLSHILRHLFSCFFNVSMRVHFFPHFLHCVCVVFICNRKSFIFVYVLVHSGHLFTQLLSWRFKTNFRKKCLLHVAHLLSIFNCWLVSDSPLLYIFTRCLLSTFPGNMTGFVCLFSPQFFN